MYPSLFKPLLDFSIAALVLILAAPVLAAVILALAVANKGQVFFLQNRPGRHQKIFRIIKLKTMNDLKDENGMLLPDEKRLTRIGNFVRSTSLDEIPQLLNVLKGDMSLVGPRPLLMEYLPLYNNVQWRRHEVKPGITGWAQVNGRNYVTWEKKFEMDVWYVDNYGFWLDMKILWLTLVKVLKSEGVNQEGQATVQYFTGNHGR
jgi:undecaprenyl phosphate N,N'-diacetylbacillosamine 1-phosphate transferase